ncbi:prepilin-type N-terminal cleavage/methylation domain-containing protein [Aquabacterium humicola]|uniref:prepilin-type N-terminal cleavage/methylation domain-containing protein n=1 Tax=Aquabacterium humicola TaxID=3237377 RepID=UPI002542A23C|nr:prepilin-type N-terminal cleavage/methylation domain-containing protein [Rubrivivax pictus]
MKMTRLPFSRRRGVSLVEALVAMAVMAFGMLAVVGVQSTLRFNSDMAKQRAEATRLAEQVIEAARGFNLVGTAGATDAEFDAIADLAPATVSGPEYNTTYTVVRNVTPDPAAGVRRAAVIIAATVTWTDRQGLAQAVTLRDTISRVDPVLSGMVIAPKTLTPIGRRDNRHPTIPPRAHDLGDGTSVFKPIETGTTAWMFNNTTGVITHICVVSAASTSSSFVVAPATCTALSYGGQLLAGEIRFNLRDIAQDLGNGTSAMKPVPTDTVAWVIDHATSKIVKNCTSIGTGTPTSSLTDTLVAGCPLANAAIAPFAVTDAAYVLTAADSENPRWPVLPVEVRMGAGGVLSTGQPWTCFSSAASLLKTAVATAPVQMSAEYFCVISGTGVTSWSGRSELRPVGYGGLSSPKWAIGNAAYEYKVCRYTQSTLPVTTNADHPLDYTSVVGNLINQNFLVISALKACPSDSAANPVTGDMVNSNTLQHQPTPP